MFRFFQGFFYGKEKGNTKLFFSTDIHCHVIPGVDDGSPNVATSLELVERMRSLGLERIYASPHVVEERFENLSPELDAALGELNHALAEKAAEEETTPFIVGRSAEYRIDDFFKELLRRGEVATLPDRHILIENSFIQEPMGMDQFVFDLRADGFKPIWAHPERYGYLYDRRARYDELHNRGLMFQLNILSLAGYYGQREKKTAEFLLEKGYVDFIGTDIHNHRHIDALEEFMGTRTYRHLAETLTPGNDSLPTQ